MNNRSGPLLKNMGILTFSNFASKILVFLLVPLYTSVLSTSEYGMYDLIVSTVSLIVPILSLNIIDAVMRYMMDRKYSHNEVATIGIVHVSISIFLVGSALFICECFKIFSQINGFKLLIFGYYVTYIINQYLIQFAKGLDKIKEMGIAGVLETVVMILTNVLFLLVWKFGIIGFFVANILSQVAPMIYFTFSLRMWTYIEKNVNRVLQMEMLLYCTPLIASVIGWWVNSGSDKYVITFFCGMAANGLLSVAYKIPSILNMFQSIFIQAWQISAIKEYGEKDTAQFYGKTFNMVNMLMCIFCAVMIIMTKPLASILYAKDFYNAWKFVPFLLISSIFNCASGFLGPVLSAKKDFRAMARSSIYGAVVNLILNIIFVQIIGIQGIVMATAIASLVIYLSRKKAANNDIIFCRYDKTIFTWIILVLLAIIEVYFDLWIIEIILLIILFWVNLADVKGIVISIQKFIKIEMIKLKERN